MTSQDAYLLNEAPAEFLAYEATAEFRLYLESKDLWEAAHAAYEAHRNPIAHNALTIAEWRMRKDLEACRKTPEHLAAFGW